MRDEVTFLESLTRWMNNPEYDLVGDLGKLSEYRDDPGEADWLAHALVLWDLLTGYRAKDEEIRPFADALRKTAPELYERMRPMLRPALRDSEYEVWREVIDDRSAHLGYLYDWKLAPHWRDWRSAYLLAFYPDIAREIDFNKIVGGTEDEKIKFWFFYYIGFIFKRRIKWYNFEDKYLHQEAVCNLIKSTGEKEILRYLEMEEVDFKIIENLSRDPKFFDLLKFLAYLTTLESIYNRLGVTLISRLYEIFSFNFENISSEIYTEYGKENFRKFIENMMIKDGIDKNKIKPEKYILDLILSKKENISDKFIYTTLKAYEFFNEKTTKNIIYIARENGINVDLFKNKNLEKGYIFRHLIKLYKRVKSLHPCDYEIIKKKRVYNIIDAIKLTMNLNSLLKIRSGEEIFINLFSFDDKVLLRRLVNCLVPYLIKGGTVGDYALDKIGPYFTPESYIILGSSCPNGAILIACHFASLDDPSPELLISARILCHENHHFKDALRKLSSQRLDALMNMSTGMLMVNRRGDAGLFLESIVKWMNDPYFNIMEKLKYFEDYKQDRNAAIWMALALTFWDALTDYQTPDDIILPMIDELIKINPEIYNKAKDILREHGLKDYLNAKEEEIIENPSAHREYLKRWNSMRDWRDWRSAYLLAQYTEAQEFLNSDEILNINLDEKIEDKINYMKFIFFYCLGSIIKLSKTPEKSEKQQESLRKFFEKLKDGGNEFYILRFILTGKKDENLDFNKIIEENIDLISFVNYLIKLNSVRYKMRKEIIERIVELNKEKEKIEEMESKYNFNIKRGDLYKYAKGIIGLSSNMITTKNKEKYTESDGRAFVQNLAKLFHRYTGIDQLLKWLANLEDKSLAQRSINLLVPLCARYAGSHTMNESNKKDIAAIANLFTPAHYLMLSDRCALGAQIAAYHFAIVPDPSAPITRIAILLARTNPDFKAALEGYSKERANWLMKELKLQAALPIEILI